MFTVGMVIPVAGTNAAAATGPPPAKPATTSDGSFDYDAEEHTGLCPSPRMEFGDYLSAHCNVRIVRLIVCAGAAVWEMASPPRDVQLSRRDVHVI